MTLTAVWHTLAQLALVALPVVVGYLCGRHIRARHLDQVERDAWDDGFRVGLRFALTVNEPTNLDAIGTQLDAAVQRASHPSDQPWLN